MNTSLFMNFKLGACALALLGCVGAVHGQSKLDELQKRIDEQRAAKARAAEQAKQGAAAQARLATLVVRSDARCELSVDGKVLGTVEEAEPREFRVGPGEQLVECRSTEVASVSESQVKAVQSGAKGVVVLALAARVQGVRERERQERERQIAAQQERERQAQLEAAERERCGSPPQPWVLHPAGSGELRQCGTGLIWAQRDNGRDVNWADAMNHCQGQGGGWRLPSSAELQSLFKAELPGVQCGEYSCKVSERFSLSGPWFWSNERNGSSEAWFVSLFTGARFSSLVGTGYRRALCVRRP